MSMPLYFIRSFFSLLCVLLLTAYTTGITSGGLTFTNLVFGICSGLGLSVVLIGADLLLKRCNLNWFNTALIGLLCGYLMGQAVWMLLNTILNLNEIQLPLENALLLKTMLFLACIYIAMMVTARASQELYFSIPFVRFKALSPKKKDILVDWTVLMDSRIVEIAASGLLDDHLIVPRFMLKELYIMLENSDETVRNKAKRCLENYKKIESIPELDLRFSDMDFTEIKDPASKLMQLARHLDANIITADLPRLQQYSIEGVRMINIHMLTNAIKPITGEMLHIKIQRYGKEPRQGVGYLEDGTMVVVNGGAEFIGETVKANILSMKHTTSGRIIFCNAAEESLIGEQMLSHASEMENANKNYFSLRD